MLRPWNLTQAQMAAMDELLSQLCAKRAAAQLGLTRVAFSSHIKNVKRKMGLTHKGVFAHILAWHDYRRANKEAA